MQTVAIFQANFFFAEINPVMGECPANTSYFNFPICSKNVYLYYVIKAPAQTFMTAIKHRSSCANVFHKVLFKNFEKFHKEMSVPWLLFNKIKGLKSVSLLRAIPRLRFFLVNFVKLLFFFS